jgi:site-specific DNA recombinase
VPEAARRRHLAAVPETPGRAVLYVRVSALMGRDGETFHSPDLQAAALRRHVGPLGLREVGVVQDLDRTGRTFAREGLDQIRSMVEAGQVDVVAVYDLSRLGRNVREALQFIQWLDERGVSVISTVEKIDDTPEGKFFLTQFLGMAQLYSDQIGRRWAEVIAARARRQHHHGVPPLGYLRGEGGALVVDPVLGPVITEAFRQYAADVPLRQITQRVARARGKRTHVTNVKRILHNPTYLGQVVIWGLPGNRPPNHRDKPAYVGPGKHEPLIDEQTWEKCQDRHHRDSRTPPRRRVPSSPLAGIAACAHCGRPAQLHSQVERRLKCAVKVTSGDCDGFGQPAVDHVLDATLDRVRERIRLLRSDPAAQAAAAGQAARAGADRALLETRLNDTRRAMGKLAAGWAAGKVPDAGYEQAMEPLVAAEREIEDQLREATASAVQPEPAAIASLAERMLAAWPKMTIAEQNRSLKQVVRRVTVRRSARWREPAADRVEVEFW